ncbi:MAG: tetratricopeptide repeat-containing sensor histidine kinase [Bacteroidota bacterium]
MPKTITYHSLQKSFLPIWLLSICWVLLLLSPPKVEAQLTVRDSVTKRMKAFERQSLGEKVNTEYIDLLNQLASEYIYVKADSLIKLSRQALSYSKKIGYTLGECQALANIGAFYSSNGINYKAITHYTNAIKLADSIGNIPLKTEFINQLAYEYTYLGDYEKALKNFLVGLDLADESDNKLMQSKLNENIANLYASQKEYDEALNFYTKVKKINDQIGDETIAAETFSNLASLHIEIGNFEHAMFNINQSISIFEKHKITDWLAYAYTVKGDIYINLKKYGWALYWYDQSQLLHKNLEDDRSRINLYNGISRAYLGVGQDSISHIFALKAMKIAKKIRSLEGQRDCSETLYLINKSQQNFTEALTYHETFQQLADSLNRDETKRTLMLLETKMKHSKDKQLLIAESEKELAKQRNLIRVSIIVLLLLIGLTVPLYLKQKKLKRLYKALQVNAENLRKNEAELNTINKTKDKLFSIIGHDLRGPLGALQGILKLVTSGEAAKEDFSRFAPKLKSDVDHILFTLNNLLSWGYAQMNGNARKPKTVSLNTLVQGNVNLLSEVANNKSIKIVNLLPDNCLIRADENQMDVVIRNLLSNAIKFTKENGLISLEAEEDDRMWRIKIRDTGVGIDQKTQKKLFNENTNVTTYGTNNEKGTGLGLSLCKEMVLKNHGEIWVESEPQKGSTFFFTIPKVTKKYRKAS